MPTVQQQEFERMLVSLVGASTVARTAAEAAYAAAVTCDAVWVVQALTEVGVKSANSAAANIALVELRKLLARDVQAFAECTVEVQDHVKAALIAFFASTQDGLLRRAAAGCISRLAVKVSEGQHAWPELMNLLTGVLQDQSGDSLETRTGCCVIISETSAWLAGAYVRTSVLAALENCVAIGNGGLASAAAHAIRAIICGADGSELPAIARSAIIPTLIEATGGRSETAALSIIEDLCEIANGQQIVVLEPHAKVLLRAMSSLARNGELDKGLRHGAIELVLRFAEADAKTFRKNKPLAAAFFELMVQYVSRPEADEEWPVTYDDTTGANGSDLEAGAAALDRIAAVLGGKAAQAMAMPHIMNNINSEFWEMRVAALTILTYVAEGCRAEFMKSLDMFVDSLILPRLSDAHPMVRNSACQCVAQMSTDFKPMFQQAFASKLLPAVCAILNDPVPRLRAMAAATLSQFFEVLDDEDHESVQPYTSHVAVALMSTLQTAEYNFQRLSMLTCMASVTYVSGGVLTPLVNEIMPIYQVLLEAAESAESDEAFRTSIEIKCRALECTTLLAASVGRDAFALHSEYLCHYLVTLMKGMRNDDARLRYALRGWTCMVQSMKDEVLPYLHDVMPHLLALANLECDVEVLDAEAGDDDLPANEQDSTVKVVRVTLADGGPKYIKIHVGRIEDKELAATIILVITQELNDFMGPWINDITSTCIALLEFRPHPPIRDTAAEILAALSLAIMKADSSKAAAFVQRVVPPLLMATDAEPDGHLARPLVASFRTIVAASPVGVLSGEPVTLAAQVFQRLMAAAELDRHAHLRAEHSRHDDDSDDNEGAQTSEAMTESGMLMLVELVDTVGSLAGSVPDFVPQFDLFLPLVARLIEDRVVAFHRLGILLLCNLIEQAPNAAAVHLRTIAGAMMNFAQIGDPDITQVSSKLGVAANAAPRPNDENFDVNASKMVTVVVRYLLLPVSRCEENQNVSASVVSCTLSVLEAFPPRDARDLAAAMHAVASHLPVQDDKSMVRINARLSRWAADPGNSALSDAARAALATL